MSLKHALLASAAALLFTAPAQAGETKEEDCPPEEGAQTLEAKVSQYSYNDSTAHQRMDAEEVGEAVGSAIAAGNLAAAHADAVDFEVDQTLKGRVDARAEAFLGDAEDDVIFNAVATGNGTTAVAEDGDLSLEAEQYAGYGTSVTSFADILMGSADVAAASGASGINVVQASAHDGALDAHIDQLSKGSASAWGGIDMVSATLAIGQSNAAGNSIALANTGGPADVSARQDQYGREIVALTDFFIGEAGDAFGSANAAGNTFTLATEGGPVGVDLRQGNSSAILANAYVEALEVTGQAASLAYGVGNAAAVSAVADSASGRFGQFNAGRVTVDALLIGNEIGEGVAQATGIGNSLSMALCAQCGEAELGGYAHQVNTGRITANSRLIAGSVGYAAGAATAIGNTASFSATPRP